MYVHLCSRLFRGALDSPDRSWWHICELLFSTLSFIYFYLPDQGGKCISQGMQQGCMGLESRINDTEE